MLKRSILVLPVVTSLLLPALMAQSAGTGALTGTVTDPSAAVVPNVTVTATNIDTNQTRTSVTGADGTYRFTLLPPAAYRVRFTATGFRTS